MADFGEKVDEKGPGEHFFGSDAENLMIHNHTVMAQPVSAVLRRTLELAVFCDEVLYRNFPERVDSSDKSRLVNYVVTIVNAVQGIYHQEELQGFVVDLKVVRLDIQTTANEGPSSSGGDIGAYLTSFCSWQQRQNAADDSDPEHWDHAFLLSGLDLHSSGNPSVIGLAWVGGMCRPTLSCTMNEGRSFMSVYVVAHELGHNFGMNHDGQGEARPCSSTKYIMSPSVGPGKTTWSTCSRSVIHSFLRNPSCLDDERTVSSTAPASKNAAGTVTSRKQRQTGLSLDVKLKPQEVKLETLLKKTPGYQFPLPDQCQAMFGRDYYPALIDQDLCKYLYCTNGVVTRPAHPALEGSFCGFHRICIAGECQPEEGLAHLLLYNLVTHDPQTSTGSALSATTTYHPVSSTATLPPSLLSTSQPATSSGLTGEPSIPPGACSNCSSILSTFPLVDAGSCSCNLPLIAETLANIPKEICQFLAPVYHQLFNCSSECPIFDLHLDLTDGSLTKVAVGPGLLEGSFHSCKFDHYTVVRGHGSGKMISMIPTNSLHTVNDPATCRGLPHFLHPTLGCPDAGALGQEQDCFPRRIVLKTIRQNITYTHSEDKHSNRSIQWKGKQYSEIRSINDDHEKIQRNRTSFALKLDKNSQPSIKCDLEAVLPKELHNLPKEVCPFLAPILHDLFKCTHGHQCLQYVVVTDLLGSNITKIPLRTPSPSVPPCTTCALDGQDTSALLLEIIQAIINLISQSSFICQLLPYSWLAWIPGCSSASLLASMSEDACPPKAVIVQVDNTTFTYTSSPNNHLGHNLPQVKWRGRTFNLKGSITGKELLMVLQEQYLLDIGGQISRKRLSEELTVMLKPRNLDYLKPASHAVNSHNLTTALPTFFGKPLQEYVGQKDIFLPVNAPMAMPRTKIGECSVTCGQGVRLVQQECVDVATEELLDDDSCQGYAVPKRQVETCHLPACYHPNWSVGGWGRCSEECGVGVQFRRVQCVITIPQHQALGGTGDYNNDLVFDPNLVVEDDQCDGQPPVNVQGCQGSCNLESGCMDEDKDCDTPDTIQISKDFDY